LVIKNLGLDPDPDPPKSLDPYPESMNLDPQLCLQGRKRGFQAGRQKYMHAGTQAHILAGWQAGRDTCRK